MRFRNPLALLVVALLLSAPRALAGVPSPANSTVPACMALCPMGDMPVSLVIRDLANNPVAGSIVVLDFSNCPGAFLCQQRPNDHYVVDLPTRTLRAPTDATGHVTFAARVGGIGVPGSVRVFADGVFLQSYALASPDQNGNGVAVNVVDVDEALFNAKVGTSDPTADFNCDGHVEAQDVFVMGFHLSHSCDGIVDAVRHSTWGSLKLHYR